MTTTTLVVGLVLALAFIFGLTNGFLDGGGLISTVVSTRLLAPLPTLALVAVCEVMGLLLLGNAVARTLGEQLLMTSAAMKPTTLLAVLTAALFGAMGWNLAMWRLSLPSSSSHALMGGLGGAAWALYGLAGLHWDVFLRIVLLLALVPTLGLVASYFLAKGVYAAGGFVTPAAKGVLRVLRIVSLGMMAMAYGSNGGQKTLGLMALALSVLGRPTGASGGWVLLLLSGSAMLIGMMAGSQRTLNTVGRRFYRLQDGQAFCAEITSMALLSASSLAGIPMSSSHLVSASIIGAGVSLRPRGVRWGLVGEMGLAWLVTIPAAGLVSFALARAFQWMAYVVS